MLPTGKHCHYQQLAKAATEPCLNPGQGALLAYIIGTTTQTKFVPLPGERTKKQKPERTTLRPTLSNSLSDAPMNAHHQWIDLGPSVWVHFQPLPRKEQARKAVNTEEKSAWMGLAVTRDNPKLCFGGLASHPVHPSLGLDQLEP